MVRCPPHPYGQLGLLIGHSSQVVVVKELLVIFPSIAATGDFLASLPTFKLPKQRRDRRGKKKDGF